MARRVVSLGWGVQSFTIAVMAAMGDIPPVDVALHSDTTWERQITYAFAAKWTAWLESKGVRVVTVSPKEASPVLLLPNGKNKVVIPAFSKGGGMIRRQCTKDWKIYPMRRWLRANFPKEQIHMLLGISLDEIERIKPSGVKYIQNQYPLIEKRMTRNDCVSYLQSHGIEVPPKSACVFCPFQGRSRLRQMAKENGKDWETAVKVDNLIRDARPPALFISPDCIPLEQIAQSSSAQLDLFQNECEGYCGV